MRIIVPERASESPGRPAEIVREYGPFPGVSQVHGVTFDGNAVWMATGPALQSFDPESGRPLRSLPVTADAGTAFDGRHLYQLAGARILKVDPNTGDVVATLPAPEPGPHAGLTWAEGTLWVARYRQKQIVQIHPQTGRVLRTLESTRFVTGVAWVEGELWHGARGQQSGEKDELLRVDPASGDVRDRLAMPEGMQVSGVEWGGQDVLFCGGGTSGTVRAVRRSSAG